MAPQPLTTVKSPAVMLAAINISGESPELISVTCWVALAVFNCVAAKLSEAGDSASVGGCETGAGERRNLRPGIVD